MQHLPQMTKYFIKFLMFECVLFVFFFLNGSTCIIIIIFLPIPKVTKLIVKFQTIWVK